MTQQTRTATKIPGAYSTTATARVVSPVKSNNGPPTYGPEAGTALLSSLLSSLSPSSAAEAANRPRSIPEAKSPTIGAGLGLPLAPLDL